MTLLLPICCCLRCAAIADQLLAVAPTALQYRFVPLAEAGTMSLMAVTTVDAQSGTVADPGPVSTLAFDRSNTAIVFTDPQNEVLSEKGLAWEFSTRQRPWLCH
jgi:hypothetical protein